MASELNGVQAKIKEKVPKATNLLAQSAQCISEYSFLRQLIDFLPLLVNRLAPICWMRLYSIVFPGLHSSDRALV